MARMPTLRKVLWALAAIGVAAMAYRFIYGLGAATNMNDGFPWGLWIAFDVMAGVALAAGGFVVVLLVHVLGLERYQPLRRPALLTALLGYVLAATSILLDLGQPQRIWHPLVSWNLHSPLFEVAMCVMTYLVVLALEFSPAVFERLGPGWQRSLRVVRSLIVPLAIAGIVLSTMHQSSLGAMMLIAPGRLHPLWYTALLPELFLISAVAAGLAMVTVESYLSARSFGQPPETPLLITLAKGTWWVLALYGVVRFADLAGSGRLASVTEGSMESAVFLVEVGVGLVLPLILLALPAVRNQLNRLVWVQGLVVAGVVLNRFSTSLIGMARSLGGRYVPSLMEVAITLGLLAIALLVYIWAVERLPVVTVHGQGATPLGPGAPPAVGARRGAPRTADGHGDD